MQQGAVGNWGHPSKFEKQHTNVKIQTDDDLVHIPAKRKKRKVKREYIHSGFCCPFCYNELPKDEKRIQEETERLKGTRYAVMDLFIRVDTCPICDAYEVNECPACKSKTWFNPKTRIYKHKSLNCGFIGIKK